MLTVDGVLAADGLAGQTGTYPASFRWAGGGGAGGSIHVTAGTLAGAGMISADGGDGGFTDLAGGGAGGRVALYYDDDTFSGVVTAGGGNGRGGGGAGTVYRKSSAQAHGDLIVDNGGRSGAVTPLASGAYIFDSLAVSGEAGLLIPADVELGWRRRR